LWSTDQPLRAESSIRWCSGNCVACDLSMRQQDGRFILTPRLSKRTLKSAPEARPLRGKPCLGP
jgi:hypothetical protein